MSKKSLIFAPQKRYNMKKLTKLFVIGLASMASAIGLRAQSVVSMQQLSLDSCVHMALANNREVKSAGLQARQYRHTQKAYFANFFPNIKGAVRDVWSTGNGSLGVEFDAAGALKDAPIHVQQMLMEKFPELTKAILELDPLKVGIDYKIKNIFQAGITVEQPLYMGGKVTAAYKMAKLGHRISEYNVQLTEDEVIVATHQAYALLLHASQMQRVAQHYDSLLNKLMTDVTNAKKHGLRSNNDVLKVKVKKGESELQLRQAENGVRLARMNLCHQIGLPLDTPVDVRELEFVNADVLAEGNASDTAPVAVSRASGDASITARPDYAMLEQKTELAAQKVKLTRSEFLPQLGVMANYSYVHGFEVMDRYLFKKPGFSVLLNLSVPIYHANEAYHKVRASKLEYERAVIEQQDLIDKMNLQLQQCANKLDESILELELTETALESASENLRAQQSAFRNGLGPVSDILEAQTLWQQAYARNVTAKAQLLVASAEYKKACGQL